MAPIITTSSTSVSNQKNKKIRKLSAIYSDTSMGSSITLHTWVGVDEVFGDDLCPKSVKEVVSKLRGTLDHQMSLCRTLLVTTSNTWWKITTLVVNSCNNGKEDSLDESTYNINRHGAIRYFALDFKTRKNSLISNSKYLDLIGRSVRPWIDTLWMSVVFTSIWVCRATGDSILFLVCALPLSRSIYCRV